MGGGIVCQKLLVENYIEINFVLEGSFLSRQTV